MIRPMLGTRRLSPRSKAFSRMFSAFAFGAWFLVAGLVGYQMDNFAPTRWTTPPILWQVGVGTALLVLGGYWYRCLPERYLLRRRADRRPIRNVGAGRSAGARQTPRGRRLSSGRS